MKKIKLTQGKYALVDDEDFEFLSQWKWHAAKRRETWYAMRTVNKSKSNPAHHSVSMQGQLLGYKGADHIDLNGLNNQRNNLRKASLKENHRNRPVRKTNKLGIKGVYYDKIHKAYRASITFERKQKTLGYFKTAKEAHEAYKKAALALHGEFARW